MGCMYCDECSDCNVGGSLGCDTYEGPDPSYDDWEKYGWNDGPEDEADDYSYPVYDDPDETAEDAPEGQVGWAYAKDHLGEQVTVFGKIAQAFYDKRYENAMRRWRAYPEAGSPYKPMYLVMGDPWPSENGISIVIWPCNRRQFEAPEENLPGKQVSVTGKPYLYEGRVYIKLSSPAQLEVHEQLRFEVQPQAFGSVYDDEIPF